MCPIKTYLLLSLLICLSILSFSAHPVFHWLLIQAIPHILRKSFGIDILV